MNHLSHIDSYVFNEISTALYIYFASFLLPIRQENENIIVSKHP